MLSRVSPAPAPAGAAVGVSSEQARVGVCAQLSPTPTFTTAFQPHTPCWSLAVGACHISPQALGEGDTPAGAGCTEQMEHSPFRLFLLTGLDHKIQIGR